MASLQIKLETMAIIAIVVFVSALMTGAALAWSAEGAKIWSELRLADIAGCFGL